MCEEWDSAKIATSTTSPVFSAGNSSVSLRGRSVLDSRYNWSQERLLWERERLVEERQYEEEKLRDLRHALQPSSWQPDISKTPPTAAPPRAPDGMFLHERGTMSDKKKYVFQQGRRYNVVLRLRPEGDLTAPPVYMTVALYPGHRIDTGERAVYLDWGPTAAGWLVQRPTSGPQAFDAYIPTTDPRVSIYAGRVYRNTNAPSVGAQPPTLVWSFIESEDLILLMFGETPEDLQGGALPVEDPFPAGDQPANLLWFDRPVASIRGGRALPEKPRERSGPVSLAPEVHGRLTTLAQETWANLLAGHAVVIPQGVEYEIKNYDPRNPHGAASLLMRGSWRGYSFQTWTEDGENVFFDYLIDNARGSASQGGMMRIMAQPDAEINFIGPPDEATETLKRRAIAPRNRNVLADTIASNPGIFNPPPPAAWRLAPPTVQTAPADDTRTPPARDGPANPAEETS